MTAVISFEKDVLNAQEQANVREAYLQIRKAMDQHAGAVRSAESLRRLLNLILARTDQIDKLSVRQPDDLRWMYRLRETLLCQRVYVEAMLDYLQQGGKSRGSAMYIDSNGEAIEKLPSYYRFNLDEMEHADLVQEVCLHDGKCDIRWRKVRPVPAEDRSFEQVWKAYREKLQSGQGGNQ